MEDEYGTCESERDELYSRFEATVQSVQRRAELKNVVLERRLAALQSDYDRAQVQLGDVLHAASLDPAVMGLLNAKLDALLDGRNAAIRDLQYNVTRVTKAYNDALRVCVPPRPRVRARDCVHALMGDAGCVGA